MDKEMETMIFKNAVCKFGIDDQVSMAKGEMGECIAALTQYFTQGKVEPEAVIDEIVDVQIMMGQMEWFMDNVAGQGATKQRYIEKMERLVNLIGFEPQHIDRSFDFSELKNNGPRPGDECEAKHQDFGWLPVRLLRKRNNGAFDVWAVEKLDTHELFWAKELRYDIKQEDIIRIVEVDVCISKNKTPEEELKDKIVDKYPNAISLFDFMEKYKTLEVGTLLVNHPSVPAVKVTSEMLDNVQILNWHFMQYWFVVDAPQWTK